MCIHNLQIRKGKGMCEFVSVFPVYVYKKIYCKEIRCKYLHRCSDALVEKSNLLLER